MILCYENVSKVETSYLLYRKIFRDKKKRLPLISSCPGTEVRIGGMIEVDASVFLKSSLSPSLSRKGTSEHMNTADS